MPRPPLSEGARDQGRTLGQLLRAGRSGRSAAAVASSAGVPLDTLRRIEQGAVAAPGFFLVARLALELGLDLDDLATASLSDMEAIS